MCRKKNAAGWSGNGSDITAGWSAKPSDITAGWYQSWTTLLLRGGQFFGPTQVLYVFYVNIKKITAGYP